MTATQVRPRRLLARRATLTLGGAYALVQWRARTAGATTSERRSLMAGDDIVRDATMTTTHAATMAVPPQSIWPWLIQMGWHQGGWYTARWVDQLLFPDNWPSADHLIPELQSRTVGDVIPDGPPASGCSFTIERCDPGRALVLHSTTHLPLTWRERWGAHLDWTWAFERRPVGDDRTRFVFRVRGRAAPWWVTVTYQLVIVPADLVMARQMIRGIRSRAATTSG